MPHKDTSSAVAGRSIFHHVEETPSPSVAKLGNTLSTFLLDSFGAAQVDIVSLRDLSNSYAATETMCISFLEVENEQMDLVRRVTSTVSHLLWITGSDAMSGYRNPDLTLRVDSADQHLKSETLELPGYPTPRPKPGK